MKKLILVVFLLFSTACAPETPCDPRVTDLQVWTQSELGLIDLINDYRVELGLVEFTPNIDLKIESDNRAEVLYFLPAITHKGVGNSFVVLRGKCYEGLTEILGGGYTTIQAVLNAWKNSVGHDRALKNPKNRYIGVTNSIGENGQTIYVILFARG